MAGFPLTNDPVQKVVELDKNEEVVLMVFPGPADVRLVQQSGAMLIFKPGVQKVPVGLKDHPWLKAHGAKPVEDVVSAATIAAPAAPATTAAPAKPPAGAVMAFNAMTKADLAVYARKNLGLDLDPDNMKKDEMVSAVLDAQQKKESADATGTGKEQGSN